MLEVTRLGSVLKPLTVVFVLCLFQSLLADLNRFKIEDVPPRLEMRKKALRLFDEIQVFLAYVLAGLQSSR